MVQLLGFRIMVGNLSQCYCFSSGIYLSSPTLILVLVIFPILSTSSLTLLCLASHILI